MSDAYREGKRRGRRTYGEGEPRPQITDPAGLLEATRARGGEMAGVAEVYTEYEEIPGGWRCWLRIPMLAQPEAAAIYGDNSRRIYGEGPTKKAAREIALGWLEEQVRNGRHLNDRMRVEDAMRRRKMR